MDGRNWLLLAAGIGAVLGFAFWFAFFARVVPVLEPPVSLGVVFPEKSKARLRPPLPSPSPAPHKFALVRACG